MLSRLLDALAYYALNPRKGNLFPVEDVAGPDEAALVTVRKQVANDLLNAPQYPRCTCLDCECGFNKSDPQARPGRGAE